MRFFRRSNVKKQIQKRRFVFCFTFLLLLFLSGSVYFSLPYLKFFKLKFVEVQGVQRGFQTETVLEKSRLQKGVPLFSIHLKEVASRLKEEIWVDRVRMKRKLPYTLAIQIIEHEPKLILSADKLYYISSAGEIFKQLEKEDSKNFPVLTGVTEQEIEQNSDKMKEVFSEAIELLKKYEKTAFAGQFGVSEIHYDFLSGFNLFPEKKKLKIIVGFSNFDAKLKRLELAIQQLGESHRSFSAIDLNYEGKVVLTSSKGG